MSRRRRGRPGKSSNSGPSLEQLEVDFVGGCGSTSLARILGAINLALHGGDISQDFVTLRRFAIVDNINAVCSSAYPFLIYAKYIAVRGLTKVLVFKTEERMDELLDDCSKCKEEEESEDKEDGGERSGKNIVQQVRDANNTTILYCLNAMINVILHISEKVDNQKDPYQMLPQAVQASHNLLLQALPRFQKLAQAINADSVEDRQLQQFVRAPSTRVVVCLCKLLTTLGIGKRTTSKLLHQMYEQGLGRALVHLMSENGALAMVHQNAQHFLLVCEKDERGRRRERDKSIVTERKYFAAYEFALKESKKGQKILRDKFEIATFEHKEKEEEMKRRTDVWQRSHDLMALTNDALQEIEVSMEEVLEFVGYISLKVVAAKEQCLSDGIVDTMLHLLSQEDNGKKLQHTRVRVRAARALGNVCDEYAAGQRHVSIGDGHRRLMELFTFHPNGMEEVVVVREEEEETIRETAATSLVQCCGDIRATSSELVEDGAVAALFSYVERCSTSSLSSSKMARSDSCAAAAAAIAHLTSRHPGLEILGGRRALPVLLTVMANGTESSSHSARIIGNAFSGAAPSAFKALVEVGGLVNICKFLIFVTKKTLSRINTESQLNILVEVLRAAEMCVSGESGRESIQNEVIGGGVLRPLLSLSTWIVETGSDGSAGHGEVQAAAMSCLFACVVGNQDGLRRILLRKNVASLLSSMESSNHAPAVTQYCRVFALLGQVDTSAQLLLFEEQVFHAVTALVRGSVAAEDDEGVVDRDDGAEKNEAAEGGSAEGGSAEGRSVEETDPTDDDAASMIQVEGANWESPTLRAAATWALRSCMDANPRILKEARSMQLFKEVLKLARLCVDEPAVCSELCLLLCSASSSAENREIVRRHGALKFCCQVLSLVPVPDPILLDGDSSTSCLETASLDSADLHEDELQHRMLDAACRAIVALCYCDARTIDAVSNDRNAVSAISHMLSERGEDLDTLHLCATIVPMLCRPQVPGGRGGRSNVMELVEGRGLSWLCYRLGELIEDADGGRARSRGRTPTAAAVPPPPRGLDLLHYRMLQKLVVAIGTIAARCRIAQDAARRAGALQHMTKILQCLKHESVVRRDPRWETILISVCDAVALLCKGSPENQQCWRRIGGGAALFYVLGDGDLRNTRLRGSGRDAVEGCADGWGAAEDAMNIVLL